MTPKMIADCGLVCSECPTLIATKYEDILAKENVASFIADTYGLHYKPDDINRDGCLSASGNPPAYCQACTIRKCAQEKSYASSALCPDQPCDALTQFHKFPPLKIYKIIAGFKFANILGALAFDKKLFIFRSVRKNANAQTCISWN